MNLRYREEVGSPAPSGGGQVVMAGGARLVSVENDDDLDAWIRSGARLVLVSRLHRCSLKRVLIRSLVQYAD